MLIKSTLREIKTSLARYLAIFGIVALGVGFFAGLKDCKESMVNTARRYLREYNMYDYQIASSYGIDDDSVALAKKHKGVKEAEGSIQIDVMASSGEADAVALKAISLPKEINKLRVVEGRLPENENECAVDNYSVGSDGYSIGQSIVLTDQNDEDKLKEFKTKEFKIVGTVNTPIYLDYQRGSTDIGDGSLGTFFCVTEEAFDVDYYTALYVTLDKKGEHFSKELEDELKAEEDDMESLAEEVNDARREKARKKAQDKLDEKIKEYEDGLEEYETEKADAESKIADARKKLDDAEDELTSKERSVRSVITDLESKIEEAEAGISKIDAGIKKANDSIKSLNKEKEKVGSGLEEAAAKKEELQKAYEAMQQGIVIPGMDEETYKEGMAETEAAIKELETAGGKIDEGIAKAEGSVKELQKQKTKAEEGLSRAKKGLDEAEAGLAEIEEGYGKIEEGRRKLSDEEAEARRKFEDAEADLEDAKRKINNAQKEIDEMETGNSYAFSKLDNTGYSSFDSNSGIVDNIAKVFPVFFFLIAALVCMTTMTRMIDEQRSQIGVLRALGYSNASIAGKYLFYSGSAALFGSLLGFFVGCKVFPAVIWNAYTMMYDFSDNVDYVINPYLGLISIGTALICSMGATWFSIRQDFSDAPSELIRPRTPPAGKRILMERIPAIWSRISFLYKVSIRNIFRDKKRFLMMVMGISGCTALLIAGLGIRTTIARIADYQFEEISVYDFITVFSEDMDEKKQADFSKYMKECGVREDDILFVHQAETSLSVKGGHEDITCTAADGDDFRKFINLHNSGEPIDFPSDGEVVIVKKLSHDYGISPGDRIKLRDGFREAEFSVSAVADNYVYDSIYMSRRTYEEGFGVKPEIKTAMVIASDASEESAEENAEETVIRNASTHAANYEDAVAVSVSMDVKDNVDNMMKSLDSVVYVVILSAALLAFIVLYNLTNINITERIREIATIKVLGFYQRETSLYVYRENMFMTAVAALVGIPLGKSLLRFVIDNIVIKMVFFEPRLTRTDIVLAVLLTFAFAILVNLAMQRRLAKVSMTESLKSVE